MKKELLMFGSLLCLMSGIGAVRAQTCATPPSCASLGYTMTSSDCSGQPTLVCPFDASAVFCAGTASSGGAGGSSSMPAECNGNCVKHNGHVFTYLEIPRNNSCIESCRNVGMYLPTVSLAKVLCSKFSSGFYASHDETFMEGFVFDGKSGNGDYWLYGYFTCQNYEYDSGGSGGYCVCVKEI